MSEVVLIKSTINPEGNFPSNKGLYSGECGSFGAGGSGSKRPFQNKTFNKHVYIKKRYSFSKSINKSINIFTFKDAKKG